jgi:ubiquinone/menaquinone biosynthesis C-methylase UbiE
MNKQKSLWDKLAKENSRYYINSDKGKKISEEDFIYSGIEDYNTHILADKIIPKKGSFLEIGCGTGRMTAFITLMYGPVYAIDISGEMIRQAKHRLRGCSNLQLMETDGETLPLENETVDLAFSYLVFQHMKTKEMVEHNFNEIHRVLRPGGFFKVLLRTDELDSLHPWWAGVSYSREEAERLCLNVGFTIERFEQVKTYAMWLWLKK